MGESPLIPSEVIEQLRRFHETIISTEDALEPFLSSKREDRLKLTALEQARCNLLSVFAINSFYWILLRLKGLNPSRSESLSNELKRTQGYMSRLRTIEERSKAPKVNRKAAASFVRNALWEPKDKDERNKQVKGDKVFVDESDAGQAKDVEQATEGVATTSLTERQFEETTSTSNGGSSKRSLPAANQVEAVSTKKMKSEKPESG